MKSNGGTRRPFKKRKNSVATEENRGQEREARCQDSRPERGEAVEPLMNGGVERVLLGQLN